MGTRPAIDYLLIANEVLASPLRRRSQLRLGVKDRWVTKELL